MTEKKVVIFASGSGTNALNLVDTFKDSLIRITAVFCDNSNAGVIEKMLQNKIPVVLISKKLQGDDLNSVLDLLAGLKPDLIVLAGFLRLFPKEICSQFSNKIINIHPALLPLHGGKGMYGMHVHEAVIVNKESKSGITIHYVNEAYDEGAIIAQFEVGVEPEDSPETLANKIHTLEYEYLPKVVAQLLN